MVAEEIRFPVRVPSPVAVGLEIAAPVVTGKTAFFFKMAEPFFALLCGSTDRGAVTGKSQTVWANQSLIGGKIQGLQFVKQENNKKEFFGFKCQRFSKERRLEES